MHFFRAKFRHVIEERRKARSNSFNIPRALTKASTQPMNALRRRFTRNPTAEAEEGHPENREITEVASDHVSAKKRKGNFKVSKDMIKRVDGGGVGMINPMGWYDGASPAPSKPTSVRERTPSPLHQDEAATEQPRAPTSGFELQHMPTYDPEDQESQPPPAPSGGGGGGFALQHVPTFHPDSASEESTEVVTDDSKKQSSASGSEDRPRSLYKDGDDIGQIRTAESSSAPNDQVTGLRTPYSGAAAGDDAFPRSRTIAFDDAQDGMEHNLHLGQNGQPSTFPRNMTTRSDDRLSRVTSNASIGMPRTYTLRTTNSRRPDPKLSGYGGFPTPIRLATDLFHRAFPSASDKLNQTLTMPRSNTITGNASQAGDDETHVPYISFSAVVGRNSNFKDLTEEQMDELGGVEYRALKLLFTIVVSVSRLAGL